MAMALCNAIFFYSSVQKSSFLNKYTTHLPTYQENDIVVLSKSNTDIMDLKSFDFPFGEKVSSHNDVLKTQKLVSGNDGFEVTENNPEMFVISLKEKASKQKWLDTFKEKDEFAAITPFQYKHLYRKELMARDSALKEHYSLLSGISLFAFIGIIFTSALLPLLVRKEMWIFLAEKVSFASALFSYGGGLALLSLVVPVLCFVSGLIFTMELRSLTMIMFHSMALQVLSIFLVSLALMIVGKGEYGKSRVF